MSSRGIGVVPVRIKIPQVRRAESILEIVARDSEEERELEVKTVTRGKVGWGFAHIRGGTSRRAVRIIFHKGLGQ